MADSKPDKGLLDTSVLIDLDAATSLPGEALISTLSMAELAAGPRRARRPARGRGHRLID